MRAASLLRSFRTRGLLKEGVAGVAAFLMVLALHQFLPRLRRPRPLAPPQPAVLGRVIEEVDASGTPAEALRRLAAAARVSFVIRPEGFDPDEPRESHSPEDLLPNGGWKRIPPPKLDLRLRHVTLGQALGVLFELSPYGARVKDCHDDSITLSFWGDDDEPPPVVRMHDLGRLNAEAANFSAAFSRAAFGTVRQATSDDVAERWSRAQLRRVLDYHLLPGPPVVTGNRAVGDCWFLRADATLQDRVEAFLAVLEEPEARAAVVAAAGAPATKGGGR